MGILSSWTNVLLGNTMYILSLKGEQWLMYVQTVQV
jgi:hypothetical protein